MTIQINDLKQPKLSTMSVRKSTTNKRKIKRQKDKEICLPSLIKTIYYERETNSPNHSNSKNYYKRSQKSYK